VNEIPLPNPGLHLYKSRGYTFKLQPIEAPRRSSVSGRMTRSRSWNAAMDMPPPPPHAFHGYAGYAPASGMVGPSSEQQPGWDQYILQLEAGGSSWQSASSAAWEQPARTDWTTVVALVEAGHPHSLQLAAHFRPEDIVTSLRGFTTSTFGSATLTTGRSKFKGLSTNTLKIPRGITHNNKQIIRPQWSSFKSSTMKVRLSTGSMGTTLDPVSKPARGEGSPEGNMYPCICIFPFHHLALHCIKKRSKPTCPLCFYFL